MRGLKIGATIIASQLMQVVRNRRAVKLPALFIARKKRRANNRKLAGTEPSEAISQQVSEPRLTAPDNRPHRGSSEELDLHSWCEQCDALAKSAIKSGGLSHDWCVELYSSGVNRALEHLPQQCREHALRIANEVFDYRSPEERQQTVRANAANGRCLHGIPFDCCPQGCGDFPDECDEYDADDCA